MLVSGYVYAMSTKQGIPAYQYQHGWYRVVGHSPELCTSVGLPILLQLISIPMSSVLQFFLDLYMYNYKIQHSGSWLQLRSTVCILQGHPAA